MLVAINPPREGAPELIRKHLEAIAPHCHWMGGRWDELDVRWNDLQNVPRHINGLSNYLLRLHASLHGEAA